MAITGSRRTFLRLLGASGALTAMAACGGAAAPTGTPAPAAKSEAQSSTAPVPAKPAASGQAITIEFLHPWEGNHGGARAMVALAKRYEELKPNVKVNQSIVTGAEYERKQLAAFASGVVPDMTLTTAETLPVYADRDVLVPLDDYMKRDKLNPKDWFDFTIAQCTWKGKLYAMTHHPDVQSIVYRNVPLMEEAGLDGSKAPTGWDDLKAWGLKMNKRDGNRVTQFGWVPTWIGRWALQFPQANGQVFLDGEGRKISYESPATVEALDFVVKATDEINGGRDRVVEFDAGQPDKGQQNVYGNAALGVAIGGNWFLDRIANVSKNEKAMKSQLSMLPGGPSAKGKEFMFGGGTMDSVVKGAKQQDAAWEYAAWIALPEGQFIAQDVSYDVGGHREAAQDPRIVNNRLLRKEILPMFDKATQMAHFYAPTWQAMRDEVVRVQDALLLKQMTPPQGANELQTKLQAILDEYWSKKK
jgi:multiple sugar transport system substrate-binding protein